MDNMINKGAMFEDNVATPNTRATAPEDYYSDYDYNDNDSMVLRAAYNSSSVTAAIVNNLGDDASLRYTNEAVEAEKNSGFEFSWDKPEVLDYVHSLPDDIQEQLSGSSTSMTELVSKVARIQKMEENNEVLYANYGAVGSFALQAATGIFDWDSVVPLGLLGKTKKFLDLAKVSGVARRTSAFAVAGGIESFASDAVYQYVQGTDNSDERLYSFIGGSVLSAAASKWMMDVTPDKTKMSVEDPVYGHREPTPEELATAKVSDGSLKVEASEEKLKEHTEKITKLKQRLGIVDKDNTVKKGSFKDIGKKTTEQHKSSIVKAKGNLKDEEIRLTKHTNSLVAENRQLEKQVINHKRYEARKKFDEAKDTHEKASEELASHMKSKKKIITQQNTLIKRLKTLEAKRNQNSKTQVKIKEVNKAIIDNSKMLDNSKKTELELENKVEIAKRLRERSKVTIGKHYKPVGSIDKVKERLTKNKQTIADNTKRLQDTKVTRERLGKLHKELTPKTKELQLNVNTALKRFNNASEELENIAETVLDAKYEDVKLQLNWFEKAMLWTPGSYLFKSENKTLNGIGRKLIAPYKPEKNSKGEYMPTRPNAMFYKQQFSNYHREMYVKTLQAFNKAVKDEDYKGKYEQFMEDVGTEYRKASTKALKEAHESISSNLTDAELLEALTKAESSLNIEYKHGITGINDAAKAVKEYLLKYGKAGKDLKATGMENVILNGSYLSRNFNYKAIEAIGRDKAIAKLAQAMREHPVNVHLGGEELLEEATHIINKVSDRGVLYDSLIGVDDTNVKSPSATRGRTISFYEADVADILNKDLNNDLLAYNYKMSGRLALKKALGVDTRAQVTELYSKLLNEQGLNANDIKNLNAVVDTVLGTREIMKNPTSLANTAMRMATKANSIIYGANFGITSLTEMANIVGTTGIKNTLGLHFDSINSAFKMAKGENVPIEWINELQSVGLLGDIVHGLHMQRYDMSESISTANALEKSLDFGQHFVHKISGLQHTTEAQRAITIGAGFNDITSMAKKLELTETDKMRLATYGLSMDDLNQVRNLVDTGVVKYDDSGKLLSFGFNQWDEALQEKIQSGLYTHLGNTVLHPDGTNLPMFATDPNSFLAKITLQFMRFPMASHEKLFLRGLSQMDSRQVTGIISSLALFTLVAKVKDLGKEDERYDLDTEDGVNNLVGYLASNMYFGGSFVTAADTISSFLTGHQLHSAYSQGTGSVLGVTNATYGSFQRASNKMVKGKYMDAFTTLQNPAWHIPILGEITKEYLKED
jgi:hypothetical protein